MSAPNRTHGVDDGPRDVLTLNPSRPAPNVRRVNVLGVGVSVLNLHSAREIVGDAIQNGVRGYLTVTGVHGVTEAQSDPGFRGILNRSFLCTPDGMPMVWMGKIAGHSEMGRVYGPDLMAELCDSGRAREWKHFFFGGAEGVAGELRDRMCRRFPGLRVVGCHTPPFRPLNAGERDALKRQVAAVKPDLFWVGLSTPKQERFMAEYLPELDVKIMAGVGAAFDFHSGRVRQAPRWIQRSGLEWFYRTCQEPRRLAGRYFRNNPLFLWRIGGQLTGWKRYPLDG